MCNKTYQCPECWCMEDDQYTCTICWTQGGQGVITDKEVSDWDIDEDDLVEVNNDY